MYWNLLNILIGILLLSGIVGGSIVLYDTLTYPSLPKPDKKRLERQRKKYGL